MAKLGRRERSLVVLGVIALALLGWVLGGERPIETVTQDIAVPEGSL